MDSHIIGIGGVFLRADDKDALTSWYRKNLDISINEYGGHDFFWRLADDPGISARTVLGFFDADSKYFEGPVMVNYIVRDLDALLAKLEAAGISQVKPKEEYSYGTFAWVRDAEGRWIELWEPVHEAPENEPPSK